MRRSVGGLVCAALLAVPCAPAVAAPGNGQLVAVVRGAPPRLVTLNPDGSGVRTLWTAPAAGDRIAEPAWSPDGNRIAFVYADAAHGARIVVLDPATGQPRAVTDHGAGASDEHPAWTPDGDRIAFLRSLGDAALGQRAATVSADGTDLQPLPFGRLLPVADADWAPDGSALAVASGGLLAVVALSGGADRFLLAFAAGGLAWSPDSERIAFEALPGRNLRVAVLGDGAPVDVTPPTPLVADRMPAWAPDGAQLAFTHGRELRTVAADGTGLQTVYTSGDVPADPAWQPCSPGVTATCVSVAPPAAPAVPVCSSASVTTQAGQPVDLPAAPCTDPAGRPLTVVVVTPPAHGTLTAPGADGRRRFTPADGFTGEDALLYKAVNGVSESAVTKLTIFVVPRPAPALMPSATRRAPFLNVRARPRLDRRGRLVLKASCDQACALDLRLTARLRSGRVVSSRSVARRAEDGRTVSLQFALRAPVPRASRIRTAWITGTATGATGDVRAVKLPVIVRR